MRDEDREIFRRAMAGARRLQTDPRVPPGRQRPRPAVRFASADADAALAASLDLDSDDIVTLSGEALCFRRPSVGKRTMRRLSRGSFAVEAELDLHGLTVTDAKAELALFIDEARRAGKRCVRVVHGKGRGSGQRGAVLKPNVDRWLRRLDGVLAFVSTRQVHGGTGAVYVLLKAS
ncbi:MAG TPA: Smr/MutS family protein [Woeseiaceae bacterium]|nr:Smr/MutS family protein [Woeseiaceae bacterium]